MLESRSRRCIIRRADMSATTYAPREHERRHRRCSEGWCAGGAHRGVRHARRVGRPSLGRRRLVHGAVLL